MRTENVMASLANYLSSSSVVAVAVQYKVKLLDLMRLRPRADHRLPFGFPQLLWIRLNWLGMVIFGSDNDLWLNREDSTEIRK